MTGIAGPDTLRTVPSSPDRTLTEVALIGMRFHTCVGILPQERDAAQPLELDLVVRHDRGASHILDYRELYESTRSLIASEPLTYLELIAESLAERALTVDGVTWCRVTVRKPHVALGGPLMHAAVSIERTRE